MSVDCYYYVTLAHRNRGSDFFQTTGILLIAEGETREEADINALTVACHHAEIEAKRMNYAQCFVHTIYYADPMSSFRSNKILYAFPAGGGVEIIDTYR